MTQQELAQQLLRLGMEIKKLQISVATLKAAVSVQSSGHPPERGKAKTYLAILEKLEQETLASDQGLQEFELLSRALKSWSPGQS